MFRNKSNETPVKTFCGFHRGRHLHHIIRHDSITTQRVILFVLSIEMICYMESHFIYIIDLNDALPWGSVYCIFNWDDITIQGAPRRSLRGLIEALSSFGTKGIHASWKVMHHELIFMYRRKSCITSWYSGIAGRYSCLAENHASREDIHVSQEDIHASQKISCTLRRYACIRKIMHRELILMHFGKVMHCG